VNENTDGSKTATVRKVKLTKRKRESKEPVPLIDKITNFLEGSPYRVDSPNTIMSYTQPRN
jgi:hypothetical protein